MNGIQTQEIISQTPVQEESSWEVRSGFRQACLLEPSKKADMAHVWVESLSDLAVFDCTRATENGVILPAYALAEKMKDGTVFSGKYNSQSRRRQ